jgi:hypothetical protein
MSAASLAVEDHGRALAPPRRRWLTRAWVLFGAGVALAVVAVVLLALLTDEGVSGDGAPSAVRVAARLVPAIAVLATGALLLAHLPRHPIGWILV